MEELQTSLRVTASRFLRSVKHFLSSEVGGTAKLLTASLVVFFLAINGLNVLNSFVGRNFMTAIVDRQVAEFARQAVFYLLVFAASTTVSVFARFTEERLALLWRDFLTRRAVNLYLTDRAFYRLDVSGELSYPDQRISEDIRAFTVTTLSFLLLIFSSGLTILSFSGVLLSINPVLFAVAFIYAACGSLLTVWLGRPLIKLNYDQLDKEASFRTGLVRARENAARITLSGTERHMKSFLAGRIDDLVANFRVITSVNRNVGFFTTGYNWLIQIIPALIVAPAFFRGDIEFGVITQSAAAFAMLVGAFSLIINQFNSISNFAAVVARLSTLSAAIENPRQHVRSEIQIDDTGEGLVYEKLTILSERDDAPLLRELTVAIPSCARVLVTGREDQENAFFRVTAGFAYPGSGRIFRPANAGIRFLPQQPYLPPSTLRQLIVPSDAGAENLDERISRLLTEFGLERISAAGGFEQVVEWDTLLTPREQQLLAMASVSVAKPRVIVLERTAATVGQDEVRKIITRFAEDGIACVHIGNVAEISLYDAILKFADDGAWQWRKRT
ncbi:ABC transporter ATP-binding protein/permease [Rhizobium sp. P32RR-XVIII]|uniref:ABC transporter ATP-binding protein/permease n=1 Tax=Rhizobium sp. P32RR-XVIII TaxID=2726738 RepID=UPI00145773EC|nr:ABC transporter ATP-binding protein/permease [Rhizobium sp. P32RR-XVIII]NLS06426.1 ABC transporter ATP-binding protein/permease [Rhizobium sp. P32RR-XVIII]